MAAFNMVNGHRVFPDDCPVSADVHVAGDRHANSGGPPQELTPGGTWTVVCPDCDIAMVGRDSAGYLICEWCGLRATSAVKR